MMCLLKERIESLGLLKAIFTGMLCLSLFACSEKPSEQEAPAAAEYDEGIEYKRINPAVPTSSGDKIEIVEVFWYGCPHCYRFEPHMLEWKKNLPENVSFVRMPAVFPNRPVWETHARAFYTAEVLGVLDETHQPLFDALHKNRQRLFTPEALADFYASYRVDKKVFLETYNSFTVDMKVNNARTLSEQYKVDGVPTLVINGKFLTHGSISGGDKGMLKVTDYLIGKESKQPGQNNTKK
jgi:thiol:disulfide interchange protein DsbA